jgi:hypothetical protein
MNKTQRRMNRMEARAQTHGFILEKGLRFPRFILDSMMRVQTSCPVDDMSLSGSLDSLRIFSMSLLFFIVLF